jgi:hypothetical protein
MKHTKSLEAKCLYFSQPFHTKDVYSEDEAVMKAMGNLTNKISKSSGLPTLDEKAVPVEKLK